MEKHFEFRKSHMELPLLAHQTFRYCLKHINIYFLWDRMGFLKKNNHSISVHSLHKYLWTIKLLTIFIIFSLFYVGN